MRILFFGTGTFAEPILAALLAAGRHEIVGLVTNPDRPAGKGKHLEMERGIKRLAVERGIPTFQPESIKTPESIARLAEFQADLFVTAAYGQILPREALALPRLAAINVHGSLLPKYRGAAPVAWAIWNGETETGVTIIRMSPQMDAGEMLAKAAIPIEPTDTTGSLLDKLAVLGAKLAVETVDRLAAGPLIGEQQNPAQVTKAPKLTKEHGLIDFTQPAERVERQIRAVQPWPSAYCYWHPTAKATVTEEPRTENREPRMNEGISGSSVPHSRFPVPHSSLLRLLVFAARVLPETTTQPPGTVVRVTKSELAIACGGGGVVGLTEVQPAGKKRQPIAEFLNGHRVQAGDGFGGEKVDT